MVDLLVVFGVGVLSGGFAIPVGFALELAPLATYLAATLGSLAAAATFLWAGHRIRNLFDDRSPVRIQSPRTQAVVNRGPRWLGIIGPTFPGVTASALIAVAIGMDRRNLIRWMAVGIAGLYAIFTVGFALITD